MVSELFDFTISNSSICFLSIPMASSSSSASANTTATTSLSSHNLINLHHDTKIKLTRDNYLLWKAQIVLYIKGLHLFGFLDGTKPAPPQSITGQSSNGATTVTTNPEFLQWHLDPLS